MVSEKSFPHATRDLIDLRSDTVTRPTEEMYEAMMNAPVGDDVLGDDPTVMRLEELAAEMLGKEAAVFMPSGTMANQVAVATHCKPGDALIAEQDSHILYYEGGSPAVIAGAVSWTLPSDLGVMDPELIEGRVTKRDEHTPGTSLLCLENTHNRAGGTVVPLEFMAEYRAIAIHNQMKIHLDGARVFNAATALKCSAAEIAAHVDSVTFCLSKGLRAPVGSLLCGQEDFIDRARMWRKRLGGGMRQAGILAACGIVSLSKMVDRLQEDHDRAKKIAGELARLPGLSIRKETVQTNIVMVDVKDRNAYVVQETLKENKVLVFALSPTRLRLVLHADIDDNKLDQALSVFKKLMKQTTYVA